MIKLNRRVKIMRLRARKLKDSEVITAPELRKKKMMKMTLTCLLTKTSSLTCKEKT
jgi:hypothetical protein